MSNIVRWFVDWIRYDMVQAALQFIVVAIAIALAGFVAAPSIDWWMQR